MDHLYLSLGIILFFFTVSDIVKTTISSMGEGFITQKLSRAIWKLYLLLSGRNGKSKVLEYAGLSILLSVLLAWILGLWFSFHLVLMSDPDSIVKSTTSAPTSSLEKFYYAGYTLSTLGNGDLKPSTDLWRVLTNIAAFSGLVFITTSVTYFISVLSAVNLQKNLSLYISGMGKTPLIILKNCWSGKDFSSFFDNAPMLSNMLMQHTLNHHAFPVIHFFHNSNQQLTILLSLAKLNEVFLVYKHMIPSNAGVDTLKLSILETALNTYFDMALSNYGHRAALKEKPFAPRLSELETQGIPFKQDAESKHHFTEGLQGSRSQVAKLLEQDGWTWTDVYHF